jgi:glycosyltransferase involved in cell wall biosynthesis
MIIAHVVEPFATGINTFIHELVFGMPHYEHYIIHGERKDVRKIEAIKKEYFGKATFIKWENAHRDINVVMDIKACVELNTILKKIDFDIIHLHSSKAGVLGRLISFINGYKNVVYTPNGASFLRKDIPQNKVAGYERIERVFSRLNGKVISSSESEHKAHSKLGIKSKIIQNGVLVDRSIRVERKSARFNIVTCGKITIQKNPSLLNEIAGFFKNDPDISFKWIGDGELKHELTNVEVTGWCSKKGVYGHLSQADLYISTSSWEGLPLAGIEAMAFGLPLLMNDCDGNRDIVNSGINGYVFDSRIKAIEDIEYLKESKSILKFLGESSLKMYERHYNNFRCAKDYDELYNAFYRKAKIANAN